MKTSTSEGKRGIQSTTQNHLDSLDFADGLALEEVESFTYLERIIDGQGVFDSDVNEKIDKVRAAFLQLKNIWNLKLLSTNIKVRIFNTNVKTVLLYGAETWRTITTIIKKAQLFINNCQLKMLNIR
ncbi:unnamed protein product [Schistosoma margrebowiei]|uniref:Uncharacterized protein n=1 Tax=Schistosoma margrebowiei TaxID=48269 RepID=A0A183LFN0_9TREM|nr:unnamed protein product [Schistosoma margrebowiei]